MEHIATHTNDFSAFPEPREIVDVSGTASTLSLAPSAVSFPDRGRTRTATRTEQGSMTIRMTRCSGLEFSFSAQILECAQDPGHRNKRDITHMPSYGKNFGFQRCTLIDLTRLFFDSCQRPRSLNGRERVVVRYSVETCKEGCLPLEAFYLVSKTLSPYSC